MLSSLHTQDAGCCRAARAPSASDRYPGVPPKSEVEVDTGMNQRTGATPAIITIGPADRVSAIGPDTGLARAAGFPAGHPILCVWRAATRKTDLYDAACTIITGAALPYETSPTGNPASGPRTSNSAPPDSPEESAGR